MIYQIKIIIKNIDKADEICEAVQNGGGFYDNCVTEHSDPPIVIVEGHDENEVKELFKTCKRVFNDPTRTATAVDTLLNKENISSITMESLPDEDTILDNRREETGHLMVRTARYYEDLLRKILSVKEILPVLMSLDNYLDTRIEEELKK